jgi:hypothetical protein
MNVNDHIRNLEERIRLHEKETKVFAWITVIATAMVFFAQMFPHLGITLFVVVFAIFFLVAWTMAGIAIYRSLIAASVGLSFILFIAQSYCLSTAPHSGDDSLKVLLVFGLIYVFTIFVKTLWRELFGHKEQKGSVKKFKELYGGRHSWLLLTLYGVSIGLFFLQLYQVMKPIVFGLCIYQ